MAFLNWSQSFSVGVKAFDDEHKGLMAIINELHDKLQAGKGKDVLASILDKLIRYTVEHFQHEEAELKRLGYPKFREHQAQHEKLKVKVTEFRNRLTIGYNGLIAIEMMKFLKSWLEQHILHDDKAYGNHLNSKGLH
ncbi:hemerythrin-like metal-binding protein [Rhizomicrobium palustre]|uniref:Hemerythrin-like metal-binding protein n=1 Tax=Rhizomicrobium palustre TaxID=189966 RepID=A0A846N129_9PROT|nr:bacteriohemerythrin [Rhizomicrobium palustre]NIK89628.1 hemerythrin-like metal-binding protein [Rhizomicrobium palustre]